MQLMVTILVTANEEDKKKRRHVVTILISCHELDRAQEKPFTTQGDRERA